MWCCLCFKIPHEAAKIFLHIAFELTMMTCIAPRRIGNAERIHVS